MRTGRWMVAVGMALALTMAACGTTADDDADSTTTTTAPDETTTTDPGTTSTEGQVDEAAQARAEAIDLVAEDVPDGWTTAPHEDDDDSDITTDCSDLDIDALALANFDDDDLQFGDPDAGAGKTIEVGTKVFEDDDTASSIVDLFSNRDFLACANDKLSDLVPGTQVEGSLEPSDYSDDSVDQTSSYVGRLTLTDPDTGDTLDLAVAFLALRTGDLVTGISASALGQEPDEDALAAVAARVAELQAG